MHFFKIKGLKSKSDLYDVLSVFIVNRTEIERREKERNVHCIGKIKRVEYFLC